MTLDHRVPPPLLAALIALAMWIVAPPLPALVSLRGLLALAIAAAGGAIAAAGARAFRRAGTTVNPLAPERASAVVTTGIYRFTRNPMYLGLLVVLVAWSLAIGWLPMLLGPVGFIAYIERFQIRPEERALALKFGDAYTQYRSRVRRWL